MCLPPASYQSPNNFTYSHILSTTTILSKAAEEKVQKLREEQEEEVSELQEKLEMSVLEKDEFELKVSGIAAV